MPIVNTDAVRAHDTGTDTRSYIVPFALVTSLFFLWGLANSLNGTLIKHFQTALHLNRAQAGIVDSAFYVGYFVMALPAGYIMSRIGYKKGILIGLLLYAAGAFIFYPAAELRVYGIFLVGLFIIASGLAFLETAANPYVTVLGKPGGEERRINFAQSFNGLSVILGPIIGSLFIYSSTEYSNDMLDKMPINEAEAIRIAEAQSVQGPYLTIAGIVLLVAVLFMFTRMPEITTGNEREASFKGIFRHRHLVFGILAQFFYVGSQSAIWGYFVDLKLHLARNESVGIVQFLIEQFLGRASDLTPTQAASYHASFALALFMAGRFVGTMLLSKFKAHNLLATYAAITVALLVYGLVGTGLPAVIAITLTYFFMSIMFPTIFALSIKNLGDQVKLGSGLVIMAIVGGAVLPPLTGWLALSNMQHALYVPIVGFLFIFLFGAYGYKVRT